MVRLELKYCVHQGIYVLESSSCGCFEAHKALPRECKQLHAVHAVSQVRSVHIQDPCSLCGTYMLLPRES